MLLILQLMIDVYTSAVYMLRIDCRKAEKTKLSLIARVAAWLLAIPDTLFFQPAFPFSDYCLKRRKVQSATDRPKKS